MTEVASTTVSPQWHTTIPTQVRPWLKIEKGDVLCWVVEDGRVYVAKKETTK